MGRLRQWLRVAIAAVTVCVAGCSDEPCEVPPPGQIYEVTRAEWVAGDCDDFGYSEMEGSTIMSGDLGRYPAGCIQDSSESADMCVVTVETYCPDEADGDFALDSVITRQGGGRLFVELQYTSFWPDGSFDCAGTYELTLDPL
jgi:hypothetical protein